MNIFFIDCENKFFHNTVKTVLYNQSFYLHWN